MGQHAQKKQIHERIELWFMINVLPERWKLCWNRPHLRINNVSSAVIVSIWWEVTVQLTKTSSMSADFIQTGSIWVVMSITQKIIKNKKVTINDHSSCDAKWTSVGNEIVNALDVYERHLQHQYLNRPREEAPIEANKSVCPSVQGALIQLWQNPELWLVKSDHVTWILDCDWLPARLTDSLQTVSGSCQTVNTNIKFREILSSMCPGPLCPQL